MPDGEFFTPITTKLERPRISANLVSRPHLIDRLNRGLNRKLTLISAPAGYGKTTVAAVWVFQSDRPYTWITLDENDDEFIQFLGYFTAAIESLFDDVFVEMEELLSAPQQPPLEYLITKCINSLSSVPEPFSLVLDDYHYIRDTSIHEFMDRLVTLLPRQVHLVLCCRTDPKLPLSLLRARRQVNEIRFEELRFSLDETRLFFERTLGTSVEPDHIVELEKSVEGWITGLQLIALSLQTHADFQEIFKGISGQANWLVMEYLIEEVFERLPRNRQEFLLRTSLPDKISAPFCDALLENDERTNEASQQMLDDLVRSNFFITPLDDDHRWYRYHNLFREMLRNRLQISLERESLARLNKRASVWLGNHGFVEEAIRHSIAAGHMRSVIQVIEHNRHDLLNRGKWRRLERWMRLMPEQVVSEEPTLLILQAWINLHATKFAEMNLSLLKAERVLEIRRDNFPEDTARAMQGELDTMHCYYSNVVLNDRRQGFEYARLALKKLPQTYSLAWGMAIDFECFGLYFAGQKDRAFRLLSDTLSDPAHHSPSKIQVYIALCHLFRISGELTHLLETADAFLQMARDNRQMVGIAYALYFMGYARYQRNQLAAVTENLEEVAKMQYSASALPYKNSMYQLALAYQNQSDPDRAREIMDNLQAYLLEIGNPAFHQEMGSVEAQLSLLEENVATASQWAKTINLEHLPDSPFVFVTQGLTWSHIRIAERTTDGLKEAVQYLQTLLITAERTHNIMWTTEILASLALAYQAQDQFEDALEALERSIKYAEPGGYIRIFVDLGPEMAVLLDRLSGLATAPNYINQIRNAFPRAEASSQLSPLASQESQGDLEEPLTSREVEVLDLLCQRLTDKEIAQKLVISQHTVRRHNHNIYQKLGVNNRREAVEKAKVLAIFSAD